MQQVAQGWLVLTLTGDPFWLGVVATRPVPAGHDPRPVRRGPRRRPAQAPDAASRVQATMMVLAVILTVLTATGVVQVWMIIVLAVLLGCANAVDMPVRQAFAIEMVGPRDIGNAVAINSAMFNGARVVGPGGRRADDRGVRHGAGVRDQRAELPGRDRRPVADARRRAPPRPARAAAPIGGGGRREPARGPRVRPPHADRAAGRDHGRPRRDVRHELPGRHPAARPGRARQRRLRLRLPDGGQRARRPRRRGGPRARRVGRGPVGSSVARSCSASRRSCWRCRPRSRSRCC